MIRFTLYLCLSFLAIACHQPPEKLPVVHLVGDSTMADKRADRRPETGWGEMIGEYLADGITVENYAQNGRSSRSFRAEGRWDTAMLAVRPGDYVFIQFGHNDPKEGDRFSSPDTYRQNLEAFVEEVRERGGNPVLLTPIVRRHFDEAGQLMETHGEYPDAVRQAAKATGTPLIDMTERTREVVSSYGDPKSTELYLWTKVGENVNYPDGVEDNTHLSPEGARLVAGLAAQGIRDAKIPLRRYLVNN